MEKNEPQVRASIVNIASQTYSLAEGSALANGDLVTLLDTESGGNVGGEVLVALLVTGVLGDVVKVFSADDEGAVHLGGNDGAGKDTTADRDLAGEGALLVWRGPTLAFQSFGSFACVVSQRALQQSFIVCRAFPPLVLRSSNPRLPSFAVLHSCRKVSSK